MDPYPTRKNHSQISQSIKESESIINAISNQINEISALPKLKYSEVFSEDIYKMFSLSFDYFDFSSSPELYTQVKSERFLKCLNIFGNKETLMNIDCNFKICSSICCSQNFIFLVGGLSEFTANGEITCINRVTLKSERIFHLKNPRFFSASLVVGDKLFVVGGIGFSELGEEKGLNSIEVFDLKNFELLGVLNMDKGLSRPCITLIGDEIFIVGKESYCIGYKIRVSDVCLSSFCFDWFQDVPYFASNYENDLLLVGENLIGTEKKIKKIDVAFSQSWAQQGPIAAQSQLFIYDYFTSKLIRVNLSF